MANLSKLLDELKEAVDNMDKKIIKFGHAPVIKVNIKTLGGVEPPKYATTESAGADLCLHNMTEKTTILPHNTVIAHTGIYLEIPDGYVGLIYARSGLATKLGVAPANKVGVIDSDYRGEILVALHNHSDEDVTLTNGERIAQIVFADYYKADFQVVDSFSESERGTGGFGSTGKN